MSITDPRDTLRFHQSRVLCQHLDLAGTPCGVLSKSLKMGLSAMGTTKPESEALAFYGMNHAVALISAHRDPLEPLSSVELSLVEAYHERSAREALRAFYYLVAICTRESRHNKSLSLDASSIEKLFGKQVATFHTEVQGGEAEIWKKFLDNPPVATLGRYCQSLQWVFYNSKWHDGYGGPKWGAVADCMVRFVTGEHTAEMMLDTVWTLCHNGGPIFNKGLLYLHWNHLLIRILDVQRSGQVPEMLLWDKEIFQYVPPGMTQAMASLRELFPDKIGDYVDWWQVEQLGAVNPYPGEKAQQAAKHGPPPHAAEAEKQAALKIAAEAKKAQEAKAAFEATNWPMTIGSGGQVVYLKKTKPDRKAA